MTFTEPKKVSLVQDKMIALINNANTWAELQELFFSFPWAFRKEILDSITKERNDKTDEIDTLKERKSDLKLLRKELRK